MLSLFLDPLALMLIMRLVTRRGVDIEYLKLFLICFVLALLVLVLSGFVGLWSLLLFLVLPWVLIHFCYLSRNASIAVSILFAAYLLAFRIAEGIISSF